MICDELEFYGHLPTVISTIYYGDGLRQTIRKRPYYHWDFCGREWWKEEIIVQASGFEKDGEIERVESHLSIKRVLPDGRKIHVNICKQIIHYGL